jgi:hypothetical protein
MTTFRLWRHLDDKDKEVRWIDCLGKPYGFIYIVYIVDI